MEFKARYNSRRPIGNRPDYKRPDASEFLVDVTSDSRPAESFRQPDNVSKVRDKHYKGSQFSRKHRYEESKASETKPINTKFQGKRNAVHKKVFNSRKTSKQRKWDEKTSGDDDKPLELSSKKRAPPLRIFPNQNKNKIFRDPRYEESSGEFNPKIFEAKYGEIIKEAKNKDREELKRELKNTKDPDRVEQIKYLLKRFEDQDKIEEESKKKEDIIKKLKEEKKKELKGIKGPVYLRKSEIKQAQLVEKFKELKKSSKLSHYIEKKRKRNVARERNKMFPDDAH